MAATNSTGFMDSITLPTVVAAAVENVAGFMESIPLPTAVAAVVENLRGLPEPASHGFGKALVDVLIAVIIAPIEFIWWICVLVVWIYAWIFALLLGTAYLVLWGLACYFAPFMLSFVPFFGAIAVWEHSVTTRRERQSVEARSGEGEVAKKEQEESLVIPLPFFLLIANIFVIVWLWWHGEEYPMVFAMRCVLGFVVQLAGLGILGAFFVGKKLWLAIRNCFIKRDHPGFGDDVEANMDTETEVGMKEEEEEFVDASTGLVAEKMEPGSHLEGNKPLS